MINNNLSLPLSSQQSGLISAFLLKSDNVLNTYFKKIKYDLSQFDKLIIIGNSMKNEPHIKKLIQEKFDRKGREIILYTRNPNNVTKEIKPFFKNGKITEVSTNSIVTIDDFFTKLSTLI